MLFVRMVLDGIAAVKFLLAGSGGHAWAVFRAHMSFYSYFRKMKQKRMAYKHEALAPSQTHYKKSIVWDYYVRQHKKFSSIPFKHFK